MFRSFFLNRRWFAWSILGTILILAATWYRVQLDVQINEWFGTFYDLVQNALSKPGSITLASYWEQLSTFLSIAMIYVTVAVVLDFFIKHYIFRWRQAMNDYYMEHWPRLRTIEGAAQRVFFIASTPKVAGKSRLHSRRRQYRAASVPKGPKADLHIRTASA